MAVTYGEFTDKKTGQPYRYVTIEEAADVTEPLLKMAEEIHDGWHANDPTMDWESFWSRLESWTLDSHDGRHLDLGSGDNTPAMRKIQRHVRAIRRIG